MAAAITADVLTGKVVGTAASYLGRTFGKIEQAAQAAAEVADSASGAQQAATAEGILFDVVSQAKAAEAATAVESAAEAGKVAEQATKAMLETGDATRVLKQEGESVKSGSDTSVSKYTFKNGKYEDASYHSAKGNNVKSPKPTDGQHALDNSFPLPGETKRRVAVSQGQFVVIDQTSPGLYHGHVRQWKELRQKMKNVLIRNKIVKPNGKIIK